MQRMYMHTNASTVVGGCERDEGFVGLQRDEGFVGLQRDEGFVGLHHPIIPTDAQGSE